MARKFDSFLPMSQDTHDREWLKRQLVSLLEGAMAAETPDHSACAKYADLLFKMLPQGAEKKSLPKDLAEQVRQALREKRPDDSGGKEAATDTKETPEPPGQAS